MQAYFRIALGAALLAGSGALPAANVQPQSSMELFGRRLSMSPVEQARLGALGSVLHGNRAAQDQALAAAQAAVTGPDARYALAAYQLEIGRQRQDDALRAPALDILIASRDTPTRLLTGYLGLRGDIAFRARDYPVAAAAWGRLLELQPDDPQVMLNLAQVRNAENDAAGAAALIARATAAARPGATPVTESSFRQRLSITHNAGLGAESMAATEALLAAFPTAANWRIGMVAYRQRAMPQGAAEIDLMRLMRATGTLTREDEYLRFTQLLVQAGLAAEARGVLDEGLSRLIVDRSRSPVPEIGAEVDRAIPREAAATRASPTGPADSLAGHGSHGEAATAYRAALQRGGSDRDTINLRLGAALALAGRRDEAEVAFGAVAEGADSRPASRWYTDLARFWLAWLAHPASGEGAAATR
jgi:tetratricopeptide (TPR) repeat protein